VCFCGLLNVQNIENHMCCWSTYVMPCAYWCLWELWYEHWLCRRVCPPQFHSSYLWLDVLSQLVHRLTSVCKILCTTVFNSRQSTYLGMDWDGSAYFKFHLNIHKISDILFLLLLGVVVPWRTVMWYNVSVDLYSCQFIVILHKYYLQPGQLSQYSD